MAPFTSTAGGLLHTGGRQDYCRKTSGESVRAKWTEAGPLLGWVWLCEDPCVSTQVQDWAWGLPSLCHSTDLLFYKGLAHSLTGECQSPSACTRQEASLSVFHPAPGHTPAQDTVFRLGTWEVGAGKAGVKVLARDLPGISL